MTKEENSRTPLDEFMYPEKEDWTAFLEGDNKDWSEFFASKNEGFKWGKAEDR